MAGTDDPLKLFDSWFEEAQASEPGEPNAMRRAFAKVIHRALSASG